MSDPAATTLNHATAIVVAYLARHDVPPADLPALIAEVRAVLDGEAPTPADAPEPARKLRPLRPTSDPAVPIAESVTLDYLISLETGQRLKVLEKHLLSFGLTPDAYRERWGLPAGYPMVAPRFGAWRSAHGRMLGLGGVARLSDERLIGGPSGDGSILMEPGQPARPGSDFSEEAAGG